MVSGNQPAFGGFANVQTPAANGTFTKLIIDTEEFDTAGAFNNTGSTVTLNGISVPSYSFAPNVAGYYQVNGCINTTTNASSFLICIFKNGGEAKRGTWAAGIDLNNTSVSSIIYMNGTSDNISLFVYQNQGGVINMASGANQTYFNAVLVRAA
jgi:hypothetical protein